MALKASICTDGEEDDFDNLGNDLEQVMSDEDMPAINSAGSWAPTRTVDQVVPSRSAHSYGRGLSQFSAAQHNNDHSVTYQTVVSSDQRTVTINQGLFEKNVGALVQGQVEKVQVAAEASLRVFQAEAASRESSLKAEVNSVLTASMNETHAATQRAHSIAQHAASEGKRAERKEQEIMTEARRLIDKANSEAAEAKEKSRRTIAEANKR